jgi:hypothetical protein
VTVSINSKFTELVEKLATAYRNTHLRSRPSYRGLARQQFASIHTRLLMCGH